MAMIPEIDDEIPLADDHLVMHEDGEDVQFEKMAGGDCSTYEHMLYLPGTPERERFKKLIKQHVSRQKVIDWGALEECGVRRRARQIIRPDTPWDRLFRMCHSTSCRPLMIEFLSTFTFSPRPAGQPAPAPDAPPPPPEISYRLFGELFECSLREFAIDTWLYTDQETRQPIYTTAIHELQDDDLVGWWPTIGDGPFTRKEGSRATRIRDPLIRYLHRCIATSISGREQSNEKVTCIDLFYLYCILTGTHCHLARCLAEYYASAYHRQQRSALVSGAFITQLAMQRQRYWGRVEAYPRPAPWQHLGFATMRNMGLARETQGGIRRFYQGGQVYVPQPFVPLPGIEGVGGIQAPQVQLQHLIAPPHSPGGGGDPEGAGQGAGHGDDQQHDHQRVPTPPGSPPQHSGRIYHAVRLPPVYLQEVMTIRETQVAIQETQQQILRYLRSLDERLGRLERGEPAAPGHGTSGTTSGPEEPAAPGHGTSGTTSGPEERPVGTSTQSELRVEDMDVDLRMNIFTQDDQPT